MAIFNTINEAVLYRFPEEDYDYTSDAAYSIYQLVNEYDRNYAATALSLGYDPHSLPDMINLLVCKWLNASLVGESEDPFGPDDPKVS